jgi:hypothetical protein
MADAIPLPSQTAPYLRAAALARVKTAVRESLKDAARELARGLLHEIDPDGREIRRALIKAKRPPGEIVPDCPRCHESDDVTAVGQDAGRRDKFVCRECGSLFVDPGHATKALVKSHMAGDGDRQRDRAVRLKARGVKYGDVL